MGSYSNDHIVVGNGGGVLVAADRLGKYGEVPSRMRALIKERPGTGLTLVELDVPRPGPKEVLIRVEKAGICGTDLHIFEWDAWASGRIALGTVIGHEFMGRVAQVGAAVTGLSVGDRVSGEGHIGCGSCYCCRTGQGHICDRVDIIGIDVHGAFADYMLLPAENVWPLHPEIPDEIGAIHDPLGNAVHTVTTGDVSGRTVLVVGAGTIGLMITSVAKAAGALDIVALDTNPRKIALAQEIGADAAFDPREPDIKERLLARTRGGRGFDVMLDASGSPAGIRLGLSLLRGGGRAALLGIPKEEVSFNLAEDVVFKGITIHGVNGRKMYDTWFQMEEFLTRRRLDVSRLITHRLPFERFADGFELMRNGEAVKVILDLVGKES